LIDVVSLFTGAGGLDLGLESTGYFDITTRIEAEPEYCKTIMSCQKAGLLRDAVILDSDFRKVDPRAVWTRPRPKIRGVVAGPPCESYSSFGLRKGHRDPRGQLLFQLIDWIDNSGADFFLIENVPFLTRGANRPGFEHLINEFRSRGFAVEFQILNAADYGAATLRKRVIVLGFRGASALEFPEPTHADPSVDSDKSGRASWVTSGEALKGLPCPALKAPGKPSGHVLISHTEPVAERFRALAPGAYDRVRRRFRLAWDRPSPSLVAGNLTGTRSHIHPLEPRELTNRECARIQGFPDSFEFSGSRCAVAKQIANAVPVALAQQIGYALGRQLEQNSPGERQRTGSASMRASVAV
jgi:DNA (cytosine-5)-methyltransferase 1